MLSMVIKKKKNKTLKFKPAFREYDNVETLAG